MSGVLKTKKQIWVIFAFLILYFAAFVYLENRDLRVLHIIHSPLDNMIPFCEYFIIPYYLWFGYMALAVAFFAFGKTTVFEYHRFIMVLGGGMTLFLIISFVFPNGLLLRPYYFSRDNIFIRMVQGLYETDTATNVFPSIHVFNSLAAAIAVWKCNSLQKHRGIRVSAVVLSVLIVLSTVFLKQHSLVDVAGGFALTFVMYEIFYKSPWAVKMAAESKEQYLIPVGLRNGKKGVVH